MFPRNFRKTLTRRVYRFVFREVYWSTKQVRHDTIELLRQQNSSFYFPSHIDITEVQFALGASDKAKETLTTNEYVIIAITSFCLGLMYIASVFLYIYLKKKKDRRNSGENSENGDKNFSRGGKFKIILALLFLLFLITFSIIFTHTP